MVYPSRISQIRRLRQSGDCKLVESELLKDLWISLEILCRNNFESKYFNLKKSKKAQLKYIHLKHLSSYRSLNYFILSNY